MKKILASRKFLCSYSVEDTSFLIGGKTAFAMVSMCDLPFSELSTYLGKYGSYTIGLSRAWGVKHKFNPVWYCDPQSMAAGFLKNYLQSVRTSGQTGAELILFANIMSYIKMVEGELPKHNYTRYRYYDEREVRFIPSFLYMMNRGEHPMMTEKEYKQYRNNGPVLLTYGVDFEWDDLKYIIVKEERQIKPLRKFLTKLGCPNDSVQLFFNKQIIEDFIGESHNEEIETYSITKDEFKNIIAMAINEMNNLTNSK